MTSPAFSDSSNPLIPQSVKDLAGGWDDPSALVDAAELEASAIDVPMSQGTERAPYGAGAVADAVTAKLAKGAQGILSGICSLPRDLFVANVAIYRTIVGHNNQLAMVPFWLRDWDASKYDALRESQCGVSTDAVSKDSTRNRIYTAGAFIGVGVGAILVAAWLSRRS